MAGNQTNSKGAGRGGARAGAGRKKGSVTKRTREIAERAAAEGITPLEYMLAVMRAPSDHEDPKIQVAREAMRFEAAKSAAPYMHPRLAAVEHTGPDGKPLTPAVQPLGVEAVAAIASMTPEQLRALASKPLKEK